MTLKFQVSSDEPLTESIYNVKWTKLGRFNDTSLSQLYDQYAQLLFNYGMHVYNNREAVKESLVELFAHLRDQYEWLAADGFVQVYLYKKFRKLLTKRILALERCQVLVSDIIDDPLSPSGELSRWQQEAFFLKLYSRFSYREVASIMDLKVESAHYLVSQQMEACEKE